MCDDFDPEGSYDMTAHNHTDPDAPGYHTHHEVPDTDSRTGLYAAIALGAILLFALWLGVK